MTWDPLTLPRSDGRTFAVTGATAGIGYFAAEQLASTGAHVVLVSRTPAKLDRARATLLEHVRGAQVDTVVLDLTSLASVAAAGAELAALPRLDGMLLNGGTMTMARGMSTSDGLPLMIGTHHVANAALAAAVLPALARSAVDSGDPARLVHTSTGFVRRFRFEIDDLLDAPRVAIAAYIHAKTATEIFAFELDRRLRARSTPVQSLVVRPGVGVDAKTPERIGVRDSTTPSQRNPVTPLAQGKDTAAWSAVRAMLDPSLRSGDYVGPAGAFRGLPVVVERSAHTATPPGDRAARLWDQTERLGGVTLSHTEGPL
ncbi:SDR family NAD(P)-dependent oxidoreductase [Labedella phragmitis]|uniref:SDR family NAD(P)-dependent oxidoreductase n=1 Tax=Labedella phragmitis TaxID=2498849 RepID=A0A3S3ZCU4_9MICO|nr:SDR family NAD(P)-dependent oxidoreductase [Labedella phragmitis]RWZ52733.1 SDR family NAD(P)-dependent oxidoreductase [Labedella phragmitis]